MGSLPCLAALETDLQQAQLASYTISQKSPVRLTGDRHLWPFFPSLLHLQEGLPLRIFTSPHWFPQCHQAHPHRQTPVGRHWQTLARWAALLAG